MEPKVLGVVLGHLPNFKKVGPSNKLVSSRRVGLEAEMEDAWFSNEEVNNNLGWWHDVGDGSLRGHRSKELILNMPIGGATLFNAISELSEFVPRQRKPVLSERCSFHVHLDVRDMTFPMLSNLIFLNSIVEPILFKYAGNERDNNIFCLPAEDCSLYNTALARATKEGRIEPFRRAVSKMLKYSAINYLSMRERGSVEYRMLPGEYRKSKVLAWVNILLSITKYVELHPDMDIEDFPGSISEQGPLKFLKELWAPKEFEALNKALDEPIEHVLMRSIRNSQEYILSADLMAEQTEQKKGWMNNPVQILNDEGGNPWDEEEEEEEDVDDPWEPNIVPRLAIRANPLAGAILQRAVADDMVDDRDNEE
tara:strand:- start:14016 stop:15116 length:1101 start_codon:yes stop_codon:yes gene_type:complete